MRCEQVHSRDARAMSCWQKVRVVSVYLYHAAFSVLPNNKLGWSFVQFLSSAATASTRWWVRELYCKSKCFNWSGNGMGFYPSISVILWQSSFNQSSFSICHRTPLHQAAVTRDSYILQLQIIVHLSCAGAYSWNRIKDICQHSLYVLSSVRAAVELYIQTTLNVSCTYGSTACVGAVARFSCKDKHICKGKAVILGVLFHACRTVTLSSYLASAEFITENNWHEVQYINKTANSYTSTLKTSFFL